MTQTAVVYSNLTSFAAHEIGHHLDFQRFDSDWEYFLSRKIYPVMLFQEYAASIYAADIMAGADRWQIFRYLVPAFFTYLLIFYNPFLGLSEERTDGLLNPIDVWTRVNAR